MSQIITGRKTHGNKFGERGKVLISACLEPTWAGLHQVSYRQLHARFRGLSIPIRWLYLQVQVHMHLEFISVCFHPFQIKS